MSNNKQNEYTAGKVALSELTTPVRKVTRVAHLLAALSAVLTIGPYIALVQLGDLLVTAHTAGLTPDRDQSLQTVTLLISMFSGQLLLLFVALGITHFADVRLAQVNRARIAKALSRLPLAWFTAKNSGRVRKAVQDDTATLHTLVAHAPVETTTATLTPLILFSYAWFVDWRLGLLTLAVIPIYVGIYSLAMRGIREKTIELDAKLATLSARMVEFISGIAVIKAFSKVGKAHGRFQEANEDFTAFYGNWSGPMLKSAAVASAVKSVPVILAVNLGIGSILVNNGTVTASQLLTTTLIALILPGSMEIIATAMWAYQMAGSAALRISELLSETQLTETTTPQIPLGNEVRFNDVTFTYGEKPVVQNISFTMPTGSITALIGPSGSGKSTLATLLARFADPQSGHITIGGIDLRNIAFMQSVHARSYSSVFSTLTSTPEIDDAYRWAIGNDLLQERCKKVLTHYFGNNPLKRKASSTLLSSLLLYAGFYLPLHFSVHGNLKNTADMIRLILRDKAVHGYYSGYKYQRGLESAGSVEQEHMRGFTYSLLEELYELELQDTDWDF